jgi:Lhr-like helicase
MEYYILASDLGSDTKIATCKFYRESQISKHADKAIRVRIPNTVTMVDEKDYKIIQGSTKTIGETDHDILFKFNGEWKERNDLGLPLLKGQNKLIEEGYHFSYNGFTGKIH